MIDTMGAAMIAGAISAQKDGDLDPTFAANMHWVVLALLPALIGMALLVAWHSRLPEGRRKEAIETFVVFGTLPLVLALLTGGMLIARNGGL